MSIARDSFLTPQPKRLCSGPGASTPALLAQSPSVWDPKLSPLFTSTPRDPDAAGPLLSPSFAMWESASNDSFKAEGGGGVGAGPPRSCRTWSPLSLSTPWRLESVLAIREVQSLRPYPAPDALGSPQRLICLQRSVQPLPDPVGLTVPNSKSASLPHLACPGPVEGKAVPSAKPGSWWQQLRPMGE